MWHIFITCLTISVFFICLYSCMSYYYLLRLSSFYFPDHRKCYLFSLVTPVCMFELHYSVDLNELNDDDNDKYNLRCAKYPDVWKITCAEKMHLLSFTKSSLTRRSSPFGSSPLPTNNQQICHLYTFSYSIKPSRVFTEVSRASNLK